LSNFDVTNVDLGNVILEDVRFEDGLLTFAGAATVVAGTILARDSVSLKFVPFVKGGVDNENGIPKAVLTYDVSATEAADVPMRALVNGRVRKERLIIDADGDGSNVDAAVLDGLRNYSITALSVKDLSVLDNQA